MLINNNNLTVLLSVAFVFTGRDNNMIVGLQIHLVHSLFTAILQGFDSLGNRPGCDL